MQRTRTVQSGFTLLELIVTLAIGAILLAVAIPSMSTLIGGNAMSATVNTLVHALQSARSEAVKRSLPVGVCTSNDPTTVEAVCDPNAGFGAGWIVYVDANRNGQRDAIDTETLVLQVEARSPAFSFTPDAVFASQVYFDGNGYSISTSGTPLSGAITIAHAAEATSRSVSIGANGAIRSAESSTVASTDADAS